MSAIRFSNWSQHRAVLLGFFAIVLTHVLSLGQARADPPATDSAAVMEMLLRKLQERDAVIRDLQRRVAELESRVGVPPARGAPGAGEAEPSQASAPTRQPLVSEGSAPAERPKAKTAPGQFVVDEEAADRALERTLVQQGALLLPAGMAEIQPSLAYTRNESDDPLLLVSDSGLTTIAEQRTRRDRLTADLLLRFGLPLDSQFEFGVPFNYVDQSRVTKLQGSPVGEKNSHDSGFGDVRLGFAKTLFRERGALPDLVGRFTWNTTSGQSKVSDGFNQLSLEFSALKRQDPLAFNATLSYQNTLEKDGVEPGDELGFGISTSLASSPQTSLQFALNQLFVNDLKANGKAIDGSDQVISNLTIGASSIVGRRTLLTFTTGIGLTDDAPDYSVGLSLSNRFDIGGF